METMKMKFILSVAALLAGCTFAAAAEAANTCPANLNGQAVDISGYTTLVQELADDADPAMLVQDANTGCGIVIYPGIDTATFEFEKLCKMGQHLTGRLMLQDYDAKSQSYMVENASDDDYRCE